MLFLATVSVEAALKLLISKEKLRLELESGSGPILSDIRSEIDSISTFLQKKENNYVLDEKSDFLLTLRIFVLVWQ